MWASCIWFLKILGHFEDDEEEESVKLCKYLYITSIAFSKI